MMSPWLIHTFLRSFAADVGQALGAVEAHGFEAAVAKHFEDLGVFWEEVSGERE